MYKKLLAVAFVTILAAAMSGCAVVGFGIGQAISAGEADKLSGIVEVGEVKTKSNANIALLKTAKISSAVFEKDMVTLNSSPGSNDAKVNTAVSDEVKRSLGVQGGVASFAVINLKTFYINSYPLDWHYRSVTEKSTLGLIQSSGIRKLVNTHFVLEQGGNTLLEVRGLWLAGNKGDEIAGASKLAREMVSEVLKKLGSPDSRRATAEAKKE